MKYKYNTPEMDLMDVSHEDVIRTSPYEFHVLNKKGDGSIDRISVEELL